MSSCSAEHNAAGAGVASEPASGPLANSGNRGLAYENRLINLQRQPLLLWNEHQSKDQRKRTGDVVYAGLLKAAS